MNAKIIQNHIRTLDQMKQFFLSLLDDPVIALSENEPDKLAELTTLRMLSKSDDWPAATDLICSEDEESKFIRAKGIIEDLIPYSLENMKFLDFGCGEGHVASIASKIAKLSIGYDIKENKNFDNLTTDWQKVKENGPYNIILINDVIDHTEENILEKVKEVALDVICIRCHPYTSRTGTHLYKSLNKAYLHLIFTEQELSSMGLNGIKTIKIIENPIEYYRKLIRKNGFKIISQKEDRTEIEDFFIQDKSIVRRIKENWIGSENRLLATGIEFPKEIMEIQFVDFIISPI